MCLARLWGGVMQKRGGFYSIYLITAFEKKYNFVCVLRDSVPVHGNWEGVNSIPFPRNIIKMNSMFRSALQPKGRKPSMKKKEFLQFLLITETLSMSYILFIRILQLPRGFKGQPIGCWWGREWRTRFDTFIYPITLKHIKTQRRSNPVNCHLAMCQDCALTDAQKLKHRIQ